MRLSLRSILAASAAIVFALAAGAVTSAPAPEAPPLPEGWYAEVHTSLGGFTIRLFVSQAPQTVAHFVGFAQGTIEYVDSFTGTKTKKPLYDGIKIHKVKFMERFEAGDPTGTSRGAPPFWVPKENGPYGFSQDYRVGMTSATGQRISGSLFFVSAVAQPELDTSQNCFGEVVVGQDAIDRIVRVKTDENKIPIDPVVIEHVRVFSVGSPPPIPDPVRYRPVMPKLELRQPAANP